MKPPPPMPQDEGLTTHTAKAVATAASMALPPSSRMTAPARAAKRCSAATMPCRAQSARLVPTLTMKTIPTPLQSAARCNERRLRAEERNDAARRDAKERSGLLRFVAEMGANDSLLEILE